jgi:hypothetical protein
MAFVIRLLFCALTVALVVIGPARANLVQNGNFATGDLTGWTLSANQISLDNNGQIVQQPNALGTQQLNSNCCGPSVVYSSALGGNAWIESEDLFYGTLGQTLATTPGHTYQVQYVFTLTGNQPVPGTFLTLFGTHGFLPQATWFAPPGCNAILSCVMPPPPLDTLTNAQIGPEARLWYIPGIYEESFTVVALDSLTALEFAGSSLGGFELTSISAIDVTALPEPASMALFAGILLAWALLFQTRHFARPRRPRTT